MIAALRRRLADLSYDTMSERRMAIFAPPDEAADRLRELSAELGAGRIICWFNPGGLIPGRDVRDAMEHLALQGLTTSLAGAASAHR